MLTASRTAVAVAVAFGSLAQPTADPPAEDGWGSVSCSDTPSPACELGAGSGGAPQGRQDTESPDPPETREGGGGGGKAAEPPASGVRCSYVISDYRPPVGGVQTASYGGADTSAMLRAAVGRAAGQPPGPDGGSVGEDGAWYVWRCTGDGWRDAVHRPPVWIPDGEEAPGAGPSLAGLAEQARQQLRLPEPAIAVSPVGDQLVNLPTWLWLQGELAPVAATAAVPGVAVTARAVPVSVTWDMGDGVEVVCRGTGTPYTPQEDPAAPSPDCGHVYRASSAGTPGGTYPVSATVSWTVSWSGAGESGTFPGLTTRASTAFRVVESQAVVTRGG